eukprot:jgi/Hompol1/451/HPOL_004732-RA
MHSTANDFKEIEASRGSKRPSAGMAGIAEAMAPAAKSARQQELIFSHTSPVRPDQWQPVLKLPREYGNATVTLKTLEIVQPRPGMSFVLEPQYTVEKAVPRSYFMVLQQINLIHTFVFSWPEPDNVFFQEIAGMRKSTFVVMKEQTTGERWEMHLKPSKERTNMFGYLYKPDDICKNIQERAEALLRLRRIPLVLDLDDTLVRVVGNTPGRYVPESEISSVMNRVRDLRDGRKVVLAERVHEFLDWAQKYFEISVCSLGDQSYVDMVVNVLDPMRTNIRGIPYSARNEYLYISSSNNTRRPPKDLLSLFPFCAVHEPGASVVDPLILDDNVNMWPADQQDNIIVVREDIQSSVWNVSLFPVVQQVLAYVHERFFQQLDAWMLDKSPMRGQPPSALTCYKDYLRRELSAKIAAGPSLQCNNNNSNNGNNNNNNKQDRLPHSLLVGVRAVLYNGNK